MPKRSKKNVRPRYIPRRRYGLLPEYEDTRIARLPWDLVINYLGVRDIVAVSLCSKEMSNLMRLNQPEPTLECDINVHVQNGKMSIQVENFDDVEDNVTFNFGNVSKQCSKTLLHANEGRMLAVECQPDQFEGVFSIWCSETKCDFTMRAVITHLTRLFNCDVYNFYVNFTGKNQHFDFRRLCPNDFTVRNMKFEGESMNGDIPYLISTVKVTETFVDKKERNHGIVSGRKLHCETLIDCGNATWINPEMFYSLNCDRVLLRRTRLTWVNIAKFIKKWKRARREDKDRIYSIRLEITDNSEKTCLERFLGKPIISICTVEGAPEESWTTKDRYGYLLTLRIAASYYVSIKVTDPNATTTSNITN